MSPVVPPRMLAGSNEGWSASAASSVADGASLSADFPPAGADDTSAATRVLIIAGIAIASAAFGAIVAAFDLNSLYVCAALIALAFILHDFRVGVVLLILLVPISHSSVFPHAMFGVTGLNPLNLLLAATLGSWFLYAIFGGGLRHFLPWQLLVLYIAPIVAGGILGSQHVADIVPGFIREHIIDFHDTAGYLAELVVKPMTLIVFGLLVGAAVARSEKPERFITPMLVAIWIVSLVVILFVLASGVALGQLASADSREFLSKLGLHANELGHLYATVFGMLLFTWSTTESRRLKVALIASIAVVLGALMLTFSRSAFFGAGVAAVLYVLWRRSFRTIGVAMLVLAIACFALPDAVYDRITSGFGGGLNDISAGRIDGLWIPLFPEIWKSPIYGSGLGSILWSAPMHAYGGQTVLAVTHPHNAYLEAALDMGFVGLVLLCGFFGWILRGFYRLSKDETVSPTMRGFCLGAAAGLIALLISDIADSSLAPRPEQAFLWLAIGMMHGQRAR